MYIESALHQRGYYTSGNTVQRDIIRLWGQQRDIKHAKECLSELHLPWGSVPGGECAAEFPHRMELQSEDEGGVYCTSEQIIFSAADCSPLLLSSFFSFTLSFHCNLLYLRTQFIKLDCLSRVVPAVSWFVWRNKQKRKMNVHNRHLSELLSAGLFLLSDLTSSWWRRKHCWDRSVSVWSTPLSRPGDGHVVDPCTSSSLAFCSLPAATSEAAMLTLQQKYTSLQPGAAQSLKSTVHRQTGNVNNSWCDRNKAISLSVLYVQIEKETTGLKTEQLRVYRIMFLLIIWIAA